LDIPVTLYVPAGFVDGAMPPPLTGTGHLAAISWGALRELAGDPRVAVGSHGFAHRDVRSLPVAAIAADVTRARRTIEDRLGRAVPHFCYPRARWSSAAEGVVRRSHDTGVVDGGRVNRASGSNLYRLSRIPVRSDMPASLLPVVGASVWLEEWVAAQARALRPPGAGEPA
jgi:peptidoglycan/xylan/chitin deacetylase (PgdA/CDA1 family)